MKIYIIISMLSLLILMVIGFHQDYKVSMNQKEDCRELHGEYVPGIGTSLCISQTGRILQHW